MKFETSVGTVSYTHLRAHETPEHLVPAGELNPDHIHTPGIFVKRIVEVGTAKKRIEFRNTRPRTAA